MNRLSVVQLQAMDYVLTRLQNITQLNEYKIVIKYDSKLVYGDFLLAMNSHHLISETHFQQSFESPFRNKRLSPSFFVDVYDDINAYVSTENNPIDYINALIETLILKIKEVDISKKDQYPRPVIYNAVFLESGLKLPFIQLNCDDEYEFVSFIDIKSLES